MERECVSELHREGRAAWAAVFSLWVLQHLKGRADELLTEVNSGSFHKFQTVLVNYYPNTISFKHSGKKETEINARNQKFISLTISAVWILAFDLVTKEGINFMFFREWTIRKVRSTRYN